MPVLPLVGSMMTVSLLEHAALFRVLDHGHADAVLDAAQRIEKFALEQNGGIQPGGDLVQFDQRRAADGFDDVVVNASHKMLVEWFGYYCAR